jgi:uncharacterized protein VirK/YbjX
MADIISKLLNLVSCTNTMRLATHTRHSLRPKKLLYALLTVATERWEFEGRKASVPLRAFG